MHLRMFANRLGKPIDDDNLPMRLLPESLEGDALDWYSGLKSQEIRTWLDLSTAFVKQYEFNCELAPTRTTLENTKRKPSEDHKSYAKRWRKIAAKVEPPMTEEEMVRIFIKAHDPPYFEEIFRMTGSSFATIVNKLEEYDEFVKAGKIVDVAALKMQLEALQNQSPNDNGKKPGFKKNEGESAFVLDQGPIPRAKFQNTPRYPAFPSYPQPTHFLPMQSSYPQHVFHTQMQPINPQTFFPRQSTFQNIPSMPQSNPHPPMQNHPRNTHLNTRAQLNQQPAMNDQPPRKRYRDFIPLGRPVDQVYEELKAAGKISTIPKKIYPRELPRHYDPQAFCDYHSGSQGHLIANCWELKHKIQDMIDDGEIVLMRERRADIECQQQSATST